MALNHHFAGFNKKKQINKRVIKWIDYIVIIKSSLEHMQTHHMIPCVKISSIKPACSVPWLLAAQGTKAYHSFGKRQIWFRPENY